MGKYKGGYSIHRFIYQQCIIYMYIKCILFAAKETVGEYQQRIMIYFLNRMTCSSSSSNPFVEPVCTPRTKHNSTISNGKKLTVWLLLHLHAYTNVDLRERNDGAEATGIRDCVAYNDILVLIYIFIHECECLCVYHMVHIFTRLLILIACVCVCGFESSWPVWFFCLTTITFWDRSSSQVLIHQNVNSGPS